MINFDMLEWISYGSIFFMAVISAYTLWYIRLRIRLHERGLLRIDYDGHKKLKSTGRALTIFDLIRMDREYKKKHKLNDRSN